MGFGQIEEKFVIIAYTLFFEINFKFFLYKTFLIYNVLGCSQYDGLRVGLYQDTDLFLVCYDITDETSLDNAVDKVRVILLRFYLDNALKLDQQSSDLHNIFEGIFTAMKF